MSQETNQEQGFNIELPEEVAAGIYSNLAVVIHSQSEFVIDFVRMLPSTPSAKVQSRIILTPDNAKRLVRALQSNIHSFEQQIAPIILPEDSMPGGAIPQGEA